MDRKIYFEHIRGWAQQDHDGLSTQQIADAVVRMCNDAIAEIEADAAEHHTSFIELKCHNCGAIIDATLTQMPRK